MQMVNFFLLKLRRYVLRLFKLRLLCIVVFYIDNLNKIYRITFVDSTLNSH